MVEKKLIILFGPPAVGKMTVGKELADLTGLKLFHNHMTYKLNSDGDFFYRANYLKLDNTQLTAVEAARQIQSHFGW